MFDPGFSHIYPLRNGLHEDFIDSQRVIIESMPSVSTADTPAAITYRASTLGNLTVYDIPRDARDLTYFVKLLRSERNAMNTGLLLGHRLAGVSSYFGGVPSDTIIPRFSVHSSNEATARSFQGIDMKLLPHYKKLDGKLRDAEEMVVSELEIIGGHAYSFSDVIVSGIRNGVHRVG